MRTSWIVLGLASTLALGCANGFSRGQMESAMRAANPVYTTSDLSLEEIDRLQPQVTFPIRLAVAPPAQTYRDDGESGGVWSKEEMAVIESWRKPLVDAGIIEDLLVLPAALVQTCAWEDVPCNRMASRTAAARVQADALLVINLATDCDEYLNPLSVLNLTIAGLWLAPGHNIDALTIAEGVMLDNRNEYIYAFARGEGEASIVRPKMYADRWKAVEPSRVQALEAFGDRFIEVASRLETRRQANAKPTPPPAAWE